MPLPDRSMRIVGAIAFRGQFQACVNGAFELRSGLRQKRWSVAGCMLGYSRGLSCTFWYIYSESTSTFILSGRVRVRARLRMCIYARTTATRIWRHADKEHKKQDPKPRRQINLCTLVCCFTVTCSCCLCLRAWLVLSAHLGARAY